MADTLAMVGLAAAGIVLAVLTFVPLAVEYGQRHGIVRKGQE